MSRPSLLVLFLTLAPLGPALLSGCASDDVLYKQDHSHPFIRVTNSGLRFQDDPVTPEEVVKRLKKLDFPKDQTLYVQITENYGDDPGELRALFVFLQNYLVNNGYTRSIMVYPTRAESGTTDKMSNKLGTKKIKYEGLTDLKGTSKQ